MPAPSGPSQQRARFFSAERVVYLVQQLRGQRVVLLRQPFERFVGQRVQALRSSDRSVPRGLLLDDESFAGEQRKVIAHRHCGEMRRAREGAHRLRPRLAERFDDDLAKLGHRAEIIPRGGGLVN